MWLFVGVSLQFFVWNEGTQHRTLKCQEASVSSYTEHWTITCVRELKYFILCDKTVRRGSLLLAGQWGQACLLSKSYRWGLRDEGTGFKVKCILNSKMFYKKGPKTQDEPFACCNNGWVFPSGGSRRTLRMGGTPSKWDALVRRLIRLTWGLWKVKHFATIDPCTLLV